MVSYRKPVKGITMTSPMDDTLTAVGRELSVAYLPIVQEPLPRELTDLSLQLDALETRKGGPSARPSKSLQSVMARLAPDRRSIDPSVGR